MPLRVVFMGTPDFAVPTLAEIVARGHDVAAVYTQPPRPAGRGMAARRSAVHDRAADLGLPVSMPSTLRDPDVQAAFAALRADVAVVVAYGLILPEPILQAPAAGCLNLHASLLPRWRGAAPIQRAVMAGDAATGVMLMRMERGLDTGPVCLAERIAIGTDETAGMLSARLARSGADLVARGLADLADGALVCAPQPEAGVTYAAKIDKAETRLDWTRGATEIHNHIRGLAPTPGAWCEMPLGGAAERVKLLGASLLEASGPPGAILALEPLTIACGRSAIVLLVLQRPGRRPAPAAEVLRGVRLERGARLT